MPEEKNAELCNFKCIEQRRKEKKKKGMEDGSGGWGAVCGREKAVRVGNGGEISGLQWDKRELHGGTKRRAVRWGEGTFGCTVPRAAARCRGVTGDEGRFPCTHCSVAWFACAAVWSLIARQEGGWDGKGGEESGGWLQ